MEFMKYLELFESDYRGGHKISLDYDVSAPLYDLSMGSAPDDIYTGFKYYFDPRDKSQVESANVIMKYKNKPEAIVTIYRGVPENATSINNGDWITLSPTYVKKHIEGEDGWKILTKRVPAKTVVWDHNDVNEFAYFPDADWKNKE